MPKRDYVFIQAPGQPWRHVDGTTAGWVAAARVPVEPGESRVGLSPCYTYAAYLSFVKTLPAHPHLEKALVGRSDRGREHWELTITDPFVPADRKQRILWHVREHAYEIFSSYAVEG